MFVFVFRSPLSGNSGAVVDIGECEQINETGRDTRVMLLLFSLLSLLLSLRTLLRIPFVNGSIFEQY